MTSVAMAGLAAGSPGRPELRAVCCLPGQYRLGRRQQDATPSAYFKRQGVYATAPTTMGGALWSTDSPASSHLLRAGHHAIAERQYVRPVVGAARPDGNLSVEA
jgi:hypothetical protein